MVHVGDSALMRCIFHSTEKKRLTKVDWMFSSGEHTKVRGGNISLWLGQDRVGRRTVSCQMHEMGGVTRAWALELVEHGLLVQPLGWAALAS